MQLSYFVKTLYILFILVLDTRRAVFRKEIVLYEF